jgi:hypothetical protein
MVARNFPFVVVAGVGFPNGYSNPVRLAVVAIDLVDLYISQMPPDSIGQPVADQSFKFVGGHRRSFQGYLLNGDICIKLAQSPPPTPANVPELTFGKLRSANNDLIVG